MYFFLPRPANPFLILTFCVYKSLIKLSLFIYFSIYEGYFESYSTLDFILCYDDTIS